MLEFILQLSQTTWAEILGWTLIHSLWQGSLIAILLVLGLRLFGIRSAQTRYTLALAALLLIPISSILTMMSERTQTHQLLSQHTGVPTIEALTPSEQQSTLQQRQETSAFWMLDRFFSLDWRTWISVLPFFWIPGVLFFSIRSLGGMWYAQRIRHMGSKASANIWQEKIKDLAQYLGISPIPELRMTRLLRSPVVIGHFRPVILMPLSMLSGLTPDQIEAILTHEMAHIYRRDYLVNILQTGIETLFFFHPAIWWISNLIRTEREHCCDDVAVKLSGKPLEYAQALAELEASYLSAPKLSLALDGHRKPLFRRIQRLLQPEQRNTGGFSHVLMIVMLGVLMSSMADFSPLPPTSGKQDLVIPPIDSLSVGVEEQSPESDTVPLTMDFQQMDSLPALELSGVETSPLSPTAGSFDSTTPTLLLIEEIPPAPPLIFPFQSISLPRGSQEEQRQFLSEMERKWEAILFYWEHDLKVWFKEFKRGVTALYMKEVDEETWNRMGSQHWQNKIQAEINKERNRALEQAYQIQQEASLTFERLRRQLNESSSLTPNDQLEKERSRLVEEKSRKDQLYLLEQELKRLEELFYKKIKEPKSEKRMEEALELFREVGKKKDALTSIQQKQEIRELAEAIEKMSREKQALQQPAIDKMKAELELKEAATRQQEEMEDLLKKLEAIQASVAYQKMEEKKKEEEREAIMGALPTELYKTYKNMGNFQLALSRSLVHDGLVKPFVKTIRITATRTGLKVNGRKLSKRESSYYKEYIEKNGIKMSHGTTLRITNNQSKKRQRSGSD
ncbi:MAG: M56 family metallopeptidase [Bacteroidota bacterium]